MFIDICRQLLQKNKGTCVYVNKHGLCLKRCNKIFEFIGQWLTVNADHKKEKMMGIPIGEGKMPIKKKLQRNEVAALCPRCRAWHIYQTSYMWNGTGTPRKMCDRCKIKADKVLTSRVAYFNCSPTLFD